MGTTRWSEKKRARRAARRSAVVLLFAAQGMAGCGGSSPPAAEPTSKSSSAPAAPRPVPPAPAGHLLRSAVVDVLSRGFGAFLARLQIEPVLVDGRFHGWRILAFTDPNDPLAKGELVPGDVVLAVNGRSLERPEQAQAAFQSLALAPELKIAYERKGAAREKVYPIDDAAPAAAAR